MKFSEAITDIFLPSKAKEEPAETAVVEDEIEAEKCETCGGGDGPHTCEAESDTRSEQKEVISPEPDPVVAPVKLKRPGRTPHPIRNIVAWVLGTALLVFAGMLFLKAFIPALILITIALVVHPAGKEFLFRYFGFDLCYRCRYWVVILGSLLFLASLGWMNEKQSSEETSTPQSQSAIPTIR